ncbi:MAG: DUF1254 domain-containing protein [Ignavibacteria bacterium]|nr:DUF1254 domain-containing protein [Ignavibacteria bacterium]
MSGLKPEEIRSIAKEAYIYGFPVVDSYRILYAYFADKTNKEYKSPMNVLTSTARVYTPEDVAVQTPNSDTPYSMIGLDLRTEPIVLNVPDIEQSRYYSIQLVDAYTFNFDYIGSRSTGNKKGSYMIAGPDWNGEKPEGIDKVIRCETQTALAIYRTQLFGPEDLGNVISVQKGYSAQPLSSFLRKPAPEPAAPIDFITPLSATEQKKSPEFFNILSYQLQFCPVNPTETELRNRFAKIGIGPGMKIDFASLPAEEKNAYEQGIADAFPELAKVKDMNDKGEINSGDLFGTREYLKNNYLYRMVAAVFGIYGNSKDEAIYLSYNIDSGKAPLSGAGRYEITFAPGKLPPVNAFWSLTMYRLPESLLVKNPINRYLINSPMMEKLRKDPDGGLTIYVQKESPGPDLESNWLPAPEGPFTCVLRLYWPKEEALNGSWKMPPMVKAG